MEIFYKKLFSLLLTLYALVGIVTGSGVLLNPPSRGVMWKEGFPTETNFNYMQLNCGGVKQSEIGQRQCGVCGDPESGPRLHELGNKYGTGTISRYYEEGAREMKVAVELLAFEKGFFEFRLCPANNKPVTQECLNQNLLPIKEGYVLGMPMRFYPSQAGIFDLTLAVPPNMTCERCVLQWRYRTANSWGVDPIDNKNGLGEGPQEEFYNCADIRIGGMVPDSILLSGNYTTESSGTSNVVWDSNQWISDINFLNNAGSVLGQDTGAMATGSADSSQGTSNVIVGQQNHVAGKTIGLDIHPISVGQMNIASGQQHGNSAVVNEVPGASQTIVGVQDQVTGLDATIDIQTVATGTDTLGTGTADSIVYEQLGIGPQGSFVTTGNEPRSVQSIIDTISSVDPMTFVDRMSANSGTGFEFTGGDMFAHSQSSLDPQLSIDGTHSTVHTQSNSQTISNDIPIGVSQAGHSMETKGSGNARFEVHTEASGMVSAGEMQGAKTFIGTENFTPIGSALHNEQGLLINSKTGSIADTNTIGQDTIISGISATDPTFMVDNIQLGVAPTEASSIVKKKTTKTASLVIAAPTVKNTISLTIDNPLRGDVAHGQTEIIDHSMIENKGTASLTIERPQQGTISLAAHDKMIYDQTEPLSADNTLTEHIQFAHGEPNIRVGTGNANQKTASLTIDGSQSGTIHFASHRNIMKDHEGLLHIDHTLSGQTEFTHTDTSMMGDRTGEKTASLAIEGLEITSQGGKMGTQTGTLQIDHTVNEHKSPMLIENTVTTDHKTASLKIKEPATETITIVSKDESIPTQTETVHIDNKFSGHTDFAHVDFTSSGNTGIAAEQELGLIVEAPQIAPNGDMMHSQTGPFLHIDHTKMMSPTIDSSKTASLLIETTQPRTVQTVVHNDIVQQTDFQQSGQMLAPSQTNENKMATSLHEGDPTRTIYMTSHGDVMSDQSGSLVHSDHVSAGDSVIRENPTVTLVNEGPTANTVETILHDGILQTGVTHIDHTSVDKLSGAKQKTASLFIENPQSEAIHVTSHTDVTHEQMAPVDTSNIFVAPSKATETKSASLVIETPQSSSIHLSTHDNTMHDKTSQSINDNIMLGSGNIDSSLLSIQKQLPFNSVAPTSETQQSIVSDGSISTVIQAEEILHPLNKKDTSVNSGLEYIAPSDLPNIVSDVNTVEIVNAQTNEAATLKIINEPIVEPNYDATSLADQSIFTSQDTISGQSAPDLSLVSLTTLQTDTQSQGKLLDTDASKSLSVDSVYQQPEVQNIIVDQTVNTVEDGKSVKETPATGGMHDVSTGLIDNTNVASLVIDKQLAVDTQLSIEPLVSESPSMMSFTPDVSLIKTEQIYAEPINAIGGTQIVNDFASASAGSELVVNNLIPGADVAQTDPAYTELSVMTDPGVAVADPILVGMTESKLDQPETVQIDPAPSVVPVEIRIQDVVENPIDSTLSGDTNLGMKDPFVHMPTQSLAVIPLEPVIPEVIPEQSITQVSGASTLQTGTLSLDMSLQKDIIPLAIPENPMVTEVDVNVSTDVAADASPVKPVKSASLSDILLDLRNVKDRLRNVAETPTDPKPEQIMTATSNIRIDATSDSKPVPDTRTELSVMTQRESTADSRASGEPSLSMGPQLRFLRDPRTGMMTRIDSGAASVFSQQSELPLPDGRVMSVSTGPSQIRSEAVTSRVGSRTTGEQMPPYMLEGSSDVLGSPRRVSNVSTRRTMAATAARDRRGQMSGRSGTQSQRIGVSRDSGQQRQGFPLGNGGMGMQATARGPSMQPRGSSMTTFQQRGTSASSMTRTPGMVPSMTRPQMPARTISTPTRAGTAQVRTGPIPMATSRMATPTFPRRSGSFMGMTGSTMGTGGMARAGTMSMMSPSTMPGSMMGSLAMRRTGMTLGTPMGAMGFPRTTLGGGVGATASRVGPTLPGVGTTISRVGSTMPGVGLTGPRVGPTISMMGPRIRPAGSMVGPAGPVAPTMIPPVGAAGFGTASIPGSISGAGMFPMSGMGSPLVGMGAPSGPFAFRGGSPVMPGLGSTIGGPTGMGLSPMFRPGFGSSFTSFGPGGFTPFRPGFPMMSMGGPGPIFR